MTAYRRAAAQERRIRDKLYEDGAVYVVRAAGSKGIADLIAFWPHPKPTWLVQAKSGKTKISGKDRMELVDLAHDCNAVPVLVTRGMNFEILNGEPDEN